jgi:hypothetical protein
VITLKPHLLALILLLAALAVSAAEDPATPPGGGINDGSFEVFFPASRAHKVTVRSGNGVVSVLEVPHGVRLSVYGAAGASFVKPESLGSPAGFDGDLTLRLRHYDESGAGESDSALDIMALAPFVLELKSVSVVAEAVER